MKHQDFTRVTEQVINGGLTVYAAAAKLEMSPATLSRRLEEIPAYVKARDEGRLHPAPDTTPVDVEAMRTNPAVLAVVNEGLSLREAFAKHPGAVGSVPTLGRWVKAAYPDHGKASGRGRRSAEDVAKPFVDVLLNYVRDTAAQLGTTPEKVCKMMSERLKEPA